MADVPASSAPVADNSTPIDSGSEDTSSDVDSGIEASDESVAAAPKPAEIKKEIAKLKKLRLKVDGKDFDEDLPFDLPDDPKAKEYMTRQLQLAKMGQNRAQQYSALEKEVVGFLNQLKTDPRKALSNPNIGLDLKKLAADIIEEEISNSQKSPEQIRAEQLEKQLQQLKEEREQEKQSAEERERVRLTEQAYEQYDHQISAALDKGDLPKSPYLVKKISDYLLSGLEKGIDVSVDDVMPLVKAEMVDDMKQLIGALPDEAVEQFIGKDLLNRLRKKNLAKAKAAPPQPVKSSIKDVTKTNLKSDAKPTDKKSYKSFFGV